jgi:hypothetical protein
MKSNQKKAIKTIKKKAIKTKTLFTVLPALPWSNDSTKFRQQNVLFATLNHRILTRDHHHSNDQSNDENHSLFVTSS